MKIEIDVTDFYLEEQELEEGLKSYVKREVIQEIFKSIEKKVQDHLTIAIREQVEKLLCQQMNVFIASYIQTGKVKSSIDSSKEVSIEEYIAEKFTKNTGWSSPDEKIKELAKKFGQDLTNRYDLLFASQLVAKMNDTGLLKEDVAKILLNGAGAKRDKF